MAEEHQSPIQRLDALETRYTELRLLHVALEVQTLILDQIVGFLITIGPKPAPEQMMQFRAAAAKQIQAKYPGIQLRLEEPKPMLYVPSPGVKLP